MQHLLLSKVLDKIIQEEENDFVFKPEDGYGILRARIETLAAQQQGTPLPTGFPIFFKHAKNGMQAQYVEVNAENLDQELRARWSRITQLNTTRWGNDTSLIKGTKFDFLLYESWPQQQLASCFQRATVFRSFINK